MTHGGVCGISKMTDVDVEREQRPVSPLNVSSRSTHIEWTTNLLRHIALRVLLPLIILLFLWQSIVIAARGEGLIDVLESFVVLLTRGDSEGHTLAQHIALSMLRVSIGFLLAIGTAVPLGIAVGRYKRVSLLFGPVIEATRPIPPIAWIPISILIFRGGTMSAQIFIIWIGAFFPVLLNTIAGVRRTSPVHLDVASTFGAREWQVLQKVVLPSAAPEVFAGLRIGFGIGWMCLVAAEMIGGGPGLGYLIIAANQTGDTGQMIFSMLLIGLIGFTITSVFLKAERRALIWQRDVSI